MDKPPLSTSPNMESGGMQEGISNTCLDLRNNLIVDGDKPYTNSS